MRALTERELRNVAVVKRLLAEVGSAKHTDAVRDLFAPGLVVHHDHPTRGAAAGSEGEFFDETPANVSILAIDICEIVANEDDVVARWHAHGTHAGEGVEVTPAKPPVDLSGMTWFRFRDGRIVELWMHGNGAGLLRRLTVAVLSPRRYYSLCCVCKKLKAPQGEWVTVESFIWSTTGRRSSHGLCPHCFEDQYRECEREAGGG